RMPPLAREPFAHDARDDVGRAAGRERHDDPHGACGIILRARRQCPRDAGQQHRETQVSYDASYNVSYNVSYNASSDAMRRSAAIPPNHHSSPSQTRHAARLVDGNLRRLDHGTPELLAATDHLTHLIWRAAERLRFQRQDAGLEVGRPKRLA